MALAVRFIFVLLFGINCRLFGNVVKRIRFEQMASLALDISFPSNTALSRKLVSSKLLCCSKCATDKLCNSLTYDAGQCTMYTRFPNPDLNYHGFLMAPYGCSTKMGFIYIREINLCYKTMPFALDCADAIHACSSINATLVEINSLERNTIIVQMLMQYNYTDMNFPGTFIAGKFTNCTWVRSNGMAFAFTDWAPNQPENKGSPGECIGLRKDFNYKWHDVENYVKIGAMCEIIILN